MKVSMSLVLMPPLLLLLCADKQDVQLLCRCCHTM